MGASRGSEIIDIVDTGQRLLRASRRMRSALGIMVLMVGWVLVLTFIMLLDAIFLPEDFVYEIVLVIIVTFVVLGIPLGIFGVAVLYEALKDRKALSDFREVFIPFWFKVKMELLPLEEGDLQGQIWERLSEAYYWHLKRRGTKVSFDADLEGSTARHRFEVHASVPSPRGPSVLGRFLDDVFVRILKKETPAGKDDVLQFTDDVNDVIKKSSHRPIILMLVSSSGFDDDAVEYASSEDGLPTENITSCLAEVDGGRMRIVWTS